MTHGNLTKMGCIDSNLLVKIASSWILYSDLKVTKPVILSFISGGGGGGGKEQNLVEHYKFYFINVLLGHVPRKIKPLISHQMCMKNYVK